MPQLNQSTADYDTFGVKNTFYRVNDRAQVGYKNFDCLAAFFVAVCGFFENSVAVEAAAVKLVCRSHKPGCRNILFGAADLAAWRRQNVTALVAKVHRTVKAADPTRLTYIQQAEKELTRLREQLMEGIIEKIPENKLLVIKDATKNKKTEQVEYVSILLKFAKENAITLENMQQITEIDSVDALNNIYSGYKSGLSIEELKPAFEKDIMPEQINGIVKILVDEKKNLKSKQGEKSKEPSKIQFQKAHQWAERQNQRMNLNKEQSKTVSKEQVENIR